MSSARESHTRSVIKAVSWRILGTLATSIIVFLFTRRWAVSLFVGAMEFVSKIGLFWLHERVWDRVAFGRSTPPGRVVWFTGSSRNDLRTMAHEVMQALVTDGETVERLDDAVLYGAVTDGVSAAHGTEVRRLGYLAGRLEAHGITVIASLGFPDEESRQAVRAMCQNYFEVYVAPPRAAGTTGGLDDHDPAMPHPADLVVDPTTTSLSDAARQVRGLLGAQRGTSLRTRAITPR